MIAKILKFDFSLEPGYFVDDKTFENNPSLLALYKNVVPKIQDLVCYDLDTSIALDKNVLKMCLELQEAFVKIGIPSFDHTYNSGVLKVIYINMLSKAVKFNSDGTGQPYLFASEKDMAEIIVKKKAGILWPYFLSIYNPPVNIIEYKKSNL